MNLFYAEGSFYHCSVCIAGNSSLDNLSWCHPCFEGTTTVLRTFHTKYFTHLCFSHTRRPTHCYEKHNTCKIGGFDTSD